MARNSFMLLVLLAMAVGCGDDPAAGGPTGGGGSGAGVGGDGGGGSGQGGGTVVGASCDPLGAPTGALIEVGPNDDVAATVAAATTGDTVMLAAGNYDMSGSALWVAQSGVTIRGATSDAAAVVLDGGYDTAGGGLINVASVSDVTIADLTIQRPRYHAIHVTGGDAPANGTLIHNVRLFDPGEQAIKVNTAGNGNYADGGEIACSHIELRDAGRQQVMQYVSSGSSCYTGGVDAHDAADWIVRDNTIVGFWCSNDDLSEHGIHFWTGSRATRVVRNRLIDNARAIGFGLVGGGRSYDDDPCPGVSNAGHYGGLIANNFIVATDPQVFASPNGVDTGIALWYACDATVAHNSIAMTSAPFSAIEWRFSETSALLVNNLATHDMVERDGASAVSEGNIDNASASEFSDIGGHDLHLAPNASAIAAGAAQGVSLAPEDIDGDARSDPPSVGADEP